MCSLTEPLLNTILTDRMSDVLEQWSAKQEHIIAHNSTLNKAEQSDLLQTLRKLSPEAIGRQFELATNPPKRDAPQETPKPFQNTLDLSAERRAELFQRGLLECAQGKAAALVLAGGQVCFITTSLSHVDSFSLSLCFRAQDSVLRRQR